MKILYLTPWFPCHRQEQMGNFILDSIESIVDEGHDVTVLVTQPWRPYLAKFIDKNWDRKKIQIEQFSDNFDLYHCYYLSIPRGFAIPLSIFFYRKRVNFFLEKIIKRHHCQLIHAHTEFSGISAVDVGRKLNIPSVVTLHGISTEKKLYVGLAKKILYDYTLSDANRVVLVGKPLVNFAKSFVKQDKHFRIVENGFRISEKNNRFFEKKWNKDHCRFISVSNLQEGKGIDLNLLALAKIKQQGYLSWTYKIIGDGCERIPLEKLTQNLNLEEHVIFLGAKNHNEVYDYLNESDVFMLPSYREAFGVAYAEAMSCGLLTVGVKGQGPEAFIQHEKTGLLVLPNNVDSLVEMIKTIFQSYDEMQNIAERGKQAIHDHFTWKAHAKNLIEIYDELLHE